MNGYWKRKFIGIYNINELRTQLFNKFNTNNYFK